MEMISMVPLFSNKVLQNNKKERARAHWLTIEYLDVNLVSTASADWLISLCRIIKSSYVSRENSPFYWWLLLSCKAAIKFVPYCNSIETEENPNTQEVHLHEELWYLCETDTTKLLKIWSLPSILLWQKVSIIYWELEEVDPGKRE